MNENTALDNRPLLPDFDADRRSLDADFPWFSVAACEVFGPLREQLRDAEEPAQ